MTFRPAEAFHPGEFLRDELDVRGWSQLDFAAITGRDTRTINEIIKGKRSITPEHALVFSKALGTTPEIWLGLEAQYRLWLATADNSDDDVVRRARLYAFPIRDMSLRGWIDQTASLAVVEKQVASFFGVTSLEIAPDVIPHAAKKSGERNLRPAQLAWLYRASHLAAHQQDIGKYSEKKLREAVTEMQALLVSPEDVRHVPRLLASAGVRFVALEGLSGLKVDGVCIWISDSPVIAMSLRFDRIDNFWFVLRHEIEHVLRGDGKGTPLSEIEPDSDLESPVTADNVSEQERLATEAAEDFCFPREILDMFVMNHSPLYSRTKIEAFASIHGRHPGIVVGQLHRRDLPYKNLRRLLVNVRQFVIRTAMTDGWGHMPQVG